MILYDQGGRSLPITRTGPPPRALRSYLEYAWTADAHGAVETGWRIVPDPAPHLIVSWTAAGGRARLVGPRTVHTDIDPSARTLTYGVRLRPGVLPLLGLAPTSDVVDRAVSLDGFGVPWATQLHRSLTSEPRPAAGREILYGTLRTLLDTSSGLDWRVEGFDTWSGGPRSRTAPPLSSVDTIADRLGVSTRTLRSRISKEVGLGPKRMAGIYRLYRALDRRLRTSHPWSRIAAHAGYSDQAHLIREFRKLLGETPARFMARSAGAPIRTIPETLDLPD